MSRDEFFDRSSSGASPGSESPLEDVVAEYVDRLNAGERINPLEILSDHPRTGQQILDQLKTFIDIDSDVSIGSPLGTLGDYTLRREIGRGGMGVVYEAWQNSMGRQVALKVLPVGIAADTKACTRFMREAQTAGKLSHQNIVGVYSTGVEEGTPWYSMEYVRGETLAQILAREKDAAPEEKTALGFPRDDVAYYSTLARCFADVADGLQHAHSKGVVHRDIKPSNLILDGERDRGGWARPRRERPHSSHPLPDEGGSDHPLPDEGWSDHILPKLRILDFGLARLEGQESLTLSGDLMGTVLYMSPEQAMAKRIPLDHRTDVYSLGVTIYEAITGRPPFRGRDHAETLSQIIEREPVGVRKLNPRVPRDLETIVLKCLRKDAADRYGTAEALGQDLRRFVRGIPIEARPESGWKRIVRRAARQRWKIVIGAALLLPALAAGVVSWKYLGERWARTTAIPEIRRLAAAGSFGAAFKLAEKAEDHIPGDPTLAELWTQFSVTTSITSDPPGADVTLRNYNEPDAPWIHVGRTPIEPIRLPIGAFCWRLARQGYAAVEGLRVTSEGPVKFTLHRDTRVPEEMVGVPGADERVRLIGLSHHRMRLAEFYIDRHEVTNREYAEFVDSGGYLTESYWKNDFVEGNDVLTWEEAMRRFRDSTGQRGPRTWRDGSYPTGKDTYPVRGVSWYEAAAYAEFVEKSLPTVYHWNRAATGFGSTAFTPYTEHIISLSNYHGQGPAPVGKYRGIGPFGTHDMAGNVKEWCWNEAGGNKRYIPGGSWREPGYMFVACDAQSPWNRSPTHGFRCARYSPDSEIPEATFARISQLSRDYSQERPVSDDEFASYRSSYRYDRGELNATVLSTEVSDACVHETIQYDAAYDDDRVTAHLFLPRHATPPYQTVLFFPGAGAFYRHRFSEDPRFRTWRMVTLILKSGRAVLWPIYKGTYDRKTALKSNRPDTTVSYRTHVIRWSQDLGTSIDYLESRDDINSGNLAYFGFSWGAAMGAILPALENERLKASVLLIGGLFPERTWPEVDQINFAARVKIPVLMLGGRYDHNFPLEASQLPLFRILGTPEEHKRHVVFETGHWLPEKAAFEEIVAWLDTYLGVEGQIAK